MSVLVTHVLVVNVPIKMVDMNVNVPQVSHLAQMVKPALMVECLVSAMPCSKITNVLIHH